MHVSTKPVKHNIDIVLKQVSSGPKTVAQRPGFLLYCEKKLRESSRNTEVNPTVFSIKAVRFMLQTSKGRGTFEDNRT